MVNYYQLLKVSPKATNAEIKSAYRRLARKIHPDVNTTDAQDASSEFAKIAKAYEILGNPKERAAYDRQLLNAQYKNSSNDDSVFTSENAHAKRWRQMAYERRYNEIIDRMIADERRETMALQKVIFPTVALFLSTCFVGIFKPMFWTNLQIIGRIILLALFIVGIVHLFDRLRKGFERYTYRDENLHESILEDKSEPVSKPYTRTTAICFLVAGIALSFGAGLLIGHFLETMISPSMPKIFSDTLRPEFIFYPPIVVLLVDLMHSLAARFDRA